MRFKLDENLPVSLAADLQASGHDTETVFDENIQGANDPRIISHARAEGRILITFDLDFSDIRNYPPGSHPGIVVLRLASQNIDSCRTAVMRATAQLDESEFQGNLLIVEDARVRVRRPDLN